MIMIYLAIGIETTHEGIEPITDLLIALGLDDISIIDEDEFLSLLNDNKRYWDFVDEELLDNIKYTSRVVIFTRNNKEGLEALELLPKELLALRDRRNDIKFGSLKIEVDKVDDNDWSNAWKKYYKPFEVGKKLLIMPSWEIVENKTDRIVFLSEPGPAFGNGTHETTRLCLEALEKYIEGDEYLFDFGSGSGILSVCAVLLGASHSIGIDIDELAVAMAKKNAIINGVADKCDFICADLVNERNHELRIHKDSADIVCANIVADAIIQLSDLAYDLIKDGGVFIASGIIDTRKPETLKKLEKSGFSIEEVFEKNGWIACVAKKPMSS